MTADDLSDFPYEPVRESGDPSVRRAYWDVATGLQKVDGLENSPYLRSLADEHVAGARGIEETGLLVRAYYRELDGRGDAGSCGGGDEADGGFREADLVSQHFAEI